MLGALSIGAFDSSQSQYNVEFEFEVLISRCRLLEVGALKPDNYAACSSWLDVTPIDLRSRHPLIREQDFLEMDAEENAAKWDIVSLSLVVNFVPERKDRGEYTYACCS